MLLEYLKNNYYINLSDECTIIYYNKVAKIHSKTNRYSHEYKIEFDGELSLANAAILRIDSKTIKLLVKRKNDETKIYAPKNPHNTLEHLAFLSLLARKIDNAI